MTAYHARDDHDLEELLHTARSRFIARSDASFNFGAGLADVYVRADLILFEQEVTAAPAAESQAEAERPGPASARRRDGAEPRSRRDIGR